MNTDRLINHLRAGFSLFWLQTDEPLRVKTKIYSELKEFTRKDGAKYKVSEWSYGGGKNPMEVLNGYSNGSAEDLQVTFLYNFHWFIDKPEVIQLLQDLPRILASRAQAIIVVSPFSKIPKELEKSFVLMKMDLPDEDEIKKVIGFVAPSAKIVPKEDKLRALIGACKSLTQTELEQVLALALIEADGKGFDLQTVNNYRAAAIEKTGFVDVLPSDLSFKDVVGYEAFKRFVLETINHPEAKGVIAIGAPGCGKTSIMKAIVGETGKFGLSINMGKLFSKYQGETERNIEAVISIITSIGDCFVLIDEFEKQFAGAGSDGSLDSGTTRRATGRWLDFLQNRPAGVYICATANSFRGIPPEFLRPGRWDTSPFHIDLPGDKTREKILLHYLQKKDMKAPKVLPNMTDFTGAEIEALVHIASMRGLTLKEASKSIIPQIKTMGEQIIALREWAETRCINAEEIISVKKSSKRALDI